MGLAEEAVRPLASKYGRRVVSGYLGDELAQRLDDRVAALRQDHPEASVTRSSVVQAALKFYLDALDAEADAG